MDQYRGTTIVSVRRDNKVVIGGDGQVSQGNTVMKGKRPQSKTPLQGSGHRRVRWRHGGCLHAIRTFRRTAGEAPWQTGSRSG